MNGQFSGVVVLPGCNKAVDISATIANIINNMEGLIVYHEEPKEINKDNPCNVTKADIGLDSKSNNNENIMNDRYYNNNMVDKDTNKDVDFMNSLEKQINKVNESYEPERSKNECCGNCSENCNQQEPELPQNDPDDDDCPVRSRCEINCDEMCLYRELGYFLLTYSQDRKNLKKIVKKLNKLLRPETLITKGDIVDIINQQNQMLYANLTKYIDV